MAPALPLVPPLFHIWIPGPRLFMRLQLFFREFKELVLAAVLIWWSLQLQLSTAGHWLHVWPQNVLRRAHVQTETEIARSRRLGPRPSRETDWRRDVGLLTPGSSGRHTHTHTRSVSVAHTHSQCKCCSSSSLTGHQHHQRTDTWVTH